MIKLRVDAFNQEIKTRGWTDQETAERMGVSAVQLWRVRLPDNDPRHNDPGKDFIAGTLVAFEKKFEELFFLDVDLRTRNEIAVTLVSAC